jgi:hypothetical protein
MTEAEFQFVKSVGFALGFEDRPSEELDAALDESAAPVAVPSERFIDLR